MYCVHCVHCVHVLISVQGAAEGVRPYEGQGAAGAPLHRARRREGHEGGATGENTTEAGHITSYYTCLVVLSADITKKMDYYRVDMKRF